MLLRTLFILSLYLSSTLSFADGNDEGVFLHIAGFDNAKYENKFTKVEEFAAVPCKELKDDELQESSTHGCVLFIREGKKTYVPYGSLTDATSWVSYAKILSHKNKMEVLVQTTEEYDHFHESSFYPATFINASLNENGSLAFFNRQDYKTAQIYQVRGSYDRSAVNLNIRDVGLLLTPKYLGKSGAFSRSIYFQYVRILDSKGEQLYSFEGIPRNFKLAMDKMLFDKGERFHRSLLISEDNYTDWESRRCSFEGYEGTYDVTQIDIYFSKTEVTMTYTVKGTFTYQSPKINIPLNQLDQGTLYWLLSLSDSTISNQVVGRMMRFIRSNLPADKKWQIKPLEVNKYGAYSTGGMNSR